jgi:hypothetical protein
VLFRSYVKMKETNEYMSVEEAAEVWKVRPERVIYTCEGDANSNGILRR